MPTVTPRAARTKSAVVPAVAYVALAAADTCLAGQSSPSRRRLRRVTKPLLMPALMSAYARATMSSPAARTRFGVLLAQGMSGAGDVALLSRTEPAFLAGVGSFLGAHVAYTTTFVANGRPLCDPTNRRATLATVAVAGSLVPVMGKAAGRRSPRLRGPVMVYAAMITAMVASSTRLSARVPAEARGIIGAGTGLFLASDTVLASRKFLMRNPTPRSDALVMATYAAGQGLIALGLAQAARAPRPAEVVPPARVEETGG